MSDRSLGNLSPSKSQPSPKNIPSLDEKQSHPLIQNDRVQIPHSHSTDSQSTCVDQEPIICYPQPSIPIASFPPLPPSPSTVLSQDSTSSKSSPAVIENTNASNVPIASSANSVQSDSDSPLTPNVYINGLPPHFPDDQLLRMTCEFGTVLSVRTFTRHVGERLSGYGFVLFVSGIFPTNFTCF